jgi:hypothetical protein
VIAPPDAPARGPTARAGAPSPLGVIAAAGAAVTVAAGAVLAFWTRSDLWLDEALSVNIARLGLGDLEPALRRDGAPPLYYALLHGWTALFGTGDGAVRALSGVAALGTFAATWFAARQWFDRTVAAIAVLLVAANPFVARYATEARMYMLVVLLVTLGLIAVPRALERPRPVRLGAVAVVTALLAYSQYWALYLVAVTGGALVLAAARDRVARRPAVATLAAMAAGAATFVAWMPTFLYQRAHTGTPWGDPVLPGLPIGETLLAFGGGDEQEGWLALLVLLPLLVLGAFAVRGVRSEVTLDLRTAPEARWLAAVGGGTLVVGTTLGYLAGQAFEPRYGAVVLPFFILLVARGVAALADERARVVVVAVVVGLGLVGGVRNVVEQRTQAGEVAAVLRGEAQPGDVVVYCPDQLGPSVHRLLPGGLDEVTYPELATPAFVNWVDYQDRLDAADPGEFAATVLERARGRTLWYVTGPGYPNHRGVCEALADDFSAARPRILRVLPAEEYFEKPGLQQYPSAAP